MKTWEAPGPGGWRRDEGRVVGAWTRYMASLFIPEFQRGVADAWKRYGVPLERIEMEMVSGRPFRRIRPIGAPDEPRPHPPKFVFKLLFWLHPELRRRGKRAQQVFAEKLWRDDVTRWFDELADEFCERNLLLHETDPADLNDVALGHHIEDLNDAYREGLYRHFIHSPVHSIPVGELLLNVSQWTGQSVSACSVLLAGSSPASAETLARLDPLVAAVRDSAEATALLTSDEQAAARVKKLRATSAAPALDAYLRVYGDRIVTGFDLHDLTLNELPEVLLSTIAARIDAEPSVANESDAAEELRALVPIEHHEAFDDLLVEARMVWGLRDHDVGITVVWRQGLLRRGLLEVARRLVERKQLRDIQHVFDCTPAEVAAMIDGEGPTAAKLALRHAERLRDNEYDLPIELGEREVPPPDDYFPPAVARMRRAVLCYIANFDSDASPVEDPGREDAVSGHAVSPGLYEGRACVVVGRDDFGRIQQGDVLIARTTAPAYNVLLPLLGAVVTDRGGCLSHAAIVVREYGIPGVVGCGDATARITSGSIVSVNGSTGVVEIVRLGRGHGESSGAEAADVLREPEVRAGGACVALHDVADESSFGGKAVALAASLRDGLPVPDGIAIDVTLTESIAAGVKSAIDELHGHGDALEGPVAVRSSAVGEDSKKASFAGQHLTVLGVQGVEAISAAVRDVWRSGRTEAALAYRKRMGVEGEPEVAVVVQRLIDPTCAGVLFTRDPVSGDAVCIIEATWGLGEGVVQGIVTPDHFRLSPSGELLEERVGEKDVAVRRAPGGGTHEVPVRKEDVDRMCLDAAQLSQLHELAKRCEEIFDAPQDIEWAFDEGELYLLQSRAITR